MRRKIVPITLSVVLASSLIACSKTPTASEDNNNNSEVKTEQQVVTGKAKGFGGEITATVTTENGKITKIDVVGDKETKNIGSKAVEELPGAIVAAGNTEVDVISGATVSSKAIIAAVNNALDPEKYPYVEETEAVEDTTPETVVAAKAFQGFGLVTTGRVGPGKDNTETPVYSINEVMANVIFDAEGKVLNITIDQIEVATPNYDGETMPHFTGFPGQSYNEDADHDEVVDGVKEATQDTFLEEISNWKSKRDRGESYVMGTGYWATQMDTYQKLFVGKTVEEIKNWYASYCSDVNGRPLKADSSKEEDIAKYSALSDDEKAMLADVVTSATMSLNDSHGDIIGAIEEAYNNRTALEIKSASYMGLGFNTSGRVGPGSDNTETSVYSINEVFANTLFENDGRIVAIHIDQLEIATPNYDGETMPHFTGFPGNSYNEDADHDEVVDGVATATEESFLSEVSSWVTKRDRGEGYVMGTGNWSTQMNAYEKIFVGMTVDEVEEWFATYCSDVNGRPLKADSSKEEDIAKYSALSEEDKTMLADIVTSATMSLNDSHGNILAAIRNSFDNKKAIDLTISE